ncbi:hypothetical protein ACFXAZ_22475 [Streptomyces sp. NPDC059477]|uniref:hypothetical protein n=1 Tax=Streptomyces sp. NPDC059477 TaxID=3346847 RepID=UPI0036BB3603
MNSDQSIEAGPEAGAGVAGAGVGALAAGPPADDVPPPVGDVPASAEDVPPPAAPRERRVLRAVLRWTAAVAVFVAVGSATAYGITGMTRTDVPGLATEADGRWEYPELVRPPLPAGRPGPFAEGNTSGAYHADLRALVLPAPSGAKENKALRGADGWLPTEDYLAEFTGKANREALGQQLVDTGLRHIAARGWTTPDGTRTRIYLLRFGTAEAVDMGVEADAIPFVSPTYPLVGAHDSVYDESFPEAANGSGIQRTAYAEPEPYGAEQVRQAYLATGNVYAVIVQSRKGGVADVPFQQTVVLQSQLLG